MLKAAGIQNCIYSSKDVVRRSVQRRRCHGWYVKYAPHRLFRELGCLLVFRRKNIQAMKPMAGAQVPNDRICAALTPTADTSSIAVSVRYT